MTSSRNSALAGLGLQRNRQQKRADARAARRRAELDAARAMCRRGTNTLTAASHRHWPRTGTRSRNSRARPLRSRTRLVRAREVNARTITAGTSSTSRTRCPCAARTNRAAARLPTATYCAGAPSDYRGAHQRHHRVLSPLMVVADHRGGSLQNSGGPMVAAPATASCANVVTHPGSPPCFAIKKPPLACRAQIAACAHGFDTIFA